MSYRKSWYLVHLEVLQTISFKIEMWMLRNSYHVSSQRNTYVVPIPTCAYSEKLRYPFQSKHLARWMEGNIIVLACSQYILWPKGMRMMWRWGCLLNQGSSYLAYFRHCPFAKKKKKKKKKDRGTLTKQKESGNAVLIRLTTCIDLYSVLTLRNCTKNAHNMSMQWRNVTRKLSTSD